MKIKMKSKIEKTLSPPSANLTRRFNNYWNPRQDTIGHFVSFLEFNKNVFSFGESIT